MSAQVRRRGFRTRLRRQDRGSTVAEFALIAGLLSLVFAGVLQFGLALHVRNTVIDAAIAGARLGGTLDRSPADGVDHTREVITAAIGEAYARDVSAVESRIDGVRVVTVSVDAPIPVLGLLGSVGTWELRGRVVAEDVSG